MTIALRTERARSLSFELLELLNEALAIDRRGRASAAEPGKVSDALWERTLLEPARHVLARQGKGFRGQLAASAYRLARGRGEPPAALRYVIELLHAGSLVIDDVEDDSHERRGAPALHRVFGVPLAINTGNWLYFWPAELIAKLDLNQGAELEAHRRFAETMSRAHRGQALDLGLRLGELAQHEVAGVAQAIASLKTGALMELGARLGALAAGADAAEREAIARFGRELGVALQQLDDWGGIASARMRHKGHEDLRLARVTWPWAVLAERLDAYAFKRLVAEQREADGPEAIDALRASLRKHVLESDGPELPRRALRAALDTLAAQPGLCRETLSELEDEIARLEVSYV